MIGVTSIQYLSNTKGNNLNLFNQNLFKGQYQQNVNTFNNIFDDKWRAQKLKLFDQMNQTNNDFNKTISQQDKFNVYNQQNDQFSDNSQYDDNNQYENNNQYDDSNSDNNDNSYENDNIDNYRDHRLLDQNLKINDLNERNQMMQCLTSNQSSKKKQTKGTKQLVQITDCKKITVKQQQFSDQNKLKIQENEICKHINKKQEVYNSVCMDCGFIIETENYQSNDCYVNKRIFTPIYDSEVREFMKDHNFDENCKQRINSQIQLFEEQYQQISNEIANIDSQNNQLIQKPKQQNNNAFAINSNIQMSQIFYDNHCIFEQKQVNKKQILKNNHKQKKQLIKKQQQQQYLIQCVKSINNLVLQDAINIANIIFKKIKVSGNNHYKIFLFIAKYLCEIECIILTFKQLCQLLGFKIDDQSSWLRVAQKMFQEFKFINQFNLKDDKQVIITLRKICIENEQQSINKKQQNVTKIIDFDNKQQIIISDNKQQIVVSDNKQQIDKFENQLIEQQLLQNIEQANQLLRNYQFEGAFNICLFVLLKNYITMNNLLFKQIEQTKHKFLYMLLKYLDTIYIYQNEQQLTDESIIQALNIKMTVKSPIWSRFIHSTTKNINTLFISKFKESMKDLSCDANLYNYLSSQINLFNNTSNQQIHQQDSLIHTILIQYQSITSETQKEHQQINNLIDNDFQNRSTKYLIYLNVLFTKFK